MRRPLQLLLTLFIIHPLAGYGHLKDRPSLHDTLGKIIQRLREEVPEEKILSMKKADVLAFLSEDEKRILGTAHLYFDVNVPVTLFVILRPDREDVPFWLEDRGFEKIALTVKVDGGEMLVWRKDFDAGTIGLGVNSITGNIDPYFVTLQPRNPGDKLEVTNLYPGEYTVGEAKIGEFIYFDEQDAIESLPDELAGQTLIRCSEARETEARIVNVYRKTPYPATSRPDHVVLTWSEDPKTTQTIQWRTSKNVSRGYVSYLKKSEYNSFKRGEPRKVKADTKPLVTPTLLNDPEIRRHTVVLRDLEPQTTYVYSVGDGSAGGWTELAEFSTAPEGVEPFSFIYMGDAQNGLERWGSLVQTSFRKRPDAAFYIMAGDLINRGEDRDDWDSFFQNAQGVFDRRTLVPILGNHEYRPEPWLYLEQFALPTNGSPNIAPEKSYSFSYSNAFFAVLDSNVPPETQSEWLDQQLASSNATWKFAVWHHPAYSSAPRRDNADIRNIWGSLLDKYHVDLALNGHDHAYLRTYPMKGGERQLSPADGTIYIVSVSGTKFYEQDPRDYTEFGMTRVSTFQVFDIQISGDRLVYRAYDLDENLKDNFVIEK